MFGKKKCQKCGKGIEKSYEFCPYCGKPTKESSPEDFGMLGKGDLEEEENLFTNPMFGGIGGNMLNKMLGNAMKMLEKEMKKGVEEQNTQKTNTNFELFINGKRVNPQNIKVTKRPMVQKPIQIKENQIRETNQRFTKQKTEKFGKLPKKSPLTNVRRFSNKVVYEVLIPGVASIEDISITKLENSIEIRAIAKDKAYEKIIPIALPIISKNLSKGKLTLELKAQD